MRGAGAPGRCGGGVYRHPHLHNNTTSEKMSWGLSVDQGPPPFSQCSLVLGVPPPGLRLLTHTVGVGDWMRQMASSRGGI